MPKRANDPEAYERLEKAIGVPSPCLELRRELHFILHGTGLALPPPRIRPKAQRTLFERSARRALELRDLLSGDDEDTLGAILPALSRSELLETLGRVAKNARKAMREVRKDRGGKAPDPRLAQTVRTLAQVYERATGRRAGLSRNDKGAPAGPFYRFVRAFFAEFAPLAGLPPLPRTPEAVGKLIQRALKGARRMDPTSH